MVNILEELTEKEVEEIFGNIAPRELKVLELLAQGLSNATIAGDLVISARSTGNYLNSIYSQVFSNVEKIEKFDRRVKTAIMFLRYKENIVKNNG